MEEDMNALALVRSDGSVMWIPPAVLRVRCVPFETEEATEGEETQEDYDWLCNFMFGSWVYNSDQIDLRFFDDAQEVDTTMFKPAYADVKIVDNSASRNIQHYDCCPEPYTDITFTLKLKNKN